MKKNILAIVALITLLVLPAACVLADSSTDNVHVNENLDVFDALTNIANYAYTLLLVVGVIAITWAGFMFITANGDPEKINKARMMVVYSIIGILFAALSRGIVALIRGVLKS
jgi:hypothetical protein